MIILKSENEINQMRRSGYVTAEILTLLSKEVKPGISTGSLNDFAETLCKFHNVTPAFKGYNGFPGSICISLNDEVIHGLPSYDKILKEGDIITLDFGVIADGWYSDSARTIAVGNVSPEIQKLIAVTEESLTLAIAQCYPGNHLYDIGNAVQSQVERFNYGLVTSFGGHGIGRALHEDPFIPNYRPNDNGILLTEGMVLAIEPMVTTGSADLKLLNDNWTLATKDGSLSAHFEHTVAITSNGPQVLTIYKELI